MSKVTRREVLGGVTRRILLAALMVLRPSGLVSRDTFKQVGRRFGIRVPTSPD